MTVQRDDWGDKFSPDGSALVPAVSSDDTHAAMMRGDPPTAAQSAAILGNDAPATTSKAPAKFDGKRPDWNAPATRNESGQFLSKSESELRAQWQSENGLANVVQTVMAKEQTMYSAAPSLEAKVGEHLDKAFLMKAADHMRLGVSYGPDGFWRSVAQFESSLSPSERDAWAKFCKSLDVAEQAALIYVLTK